MYIKYLFFFLYFFCVDKYLFSGIVCSIVIHKLKINMSIKESILECSLFFFL